MHATELELELLRTGEACVATVAHLATCEECQQRSAFFVACADDQGLVDVSTAIPTEIDVNLRAMAQKQAARVRNEIRRQQRRRWVSAIAAVAAAILILLIVPMMHRDHQTPVQYAAADVNRDGRVDILDALVLERMTETTTDETWDFNEDGRIDADDVDFVAKLAVAIGGKSS